MKSHLWKSYKHYSKETNKLKVNKINKIKAITGSDPLIIKFLEEISEKEALELEIKMISTIGRINLKTGPLTNLTDGGEGTINISPETLEKRRNSNIGKHTMTEEHKEILKKINTGRKPSDEAKNKMSKAHKGIKFSESHKKSLAISLLNNKNNLGYKWTEQRKKEQSDRRKGHEVSAETRRKISLNHADFSGKNSPSWKYYYKLINPDGEEYLNITQMRLFCGNHGLIYASVMNCLKKDIKNLKAGLLKDLRKFLYNNIITGRNSRTGEEPLQGSLARWNSGAIHHNRII